MRISATKMQNENKNGFTKTEENDWSLKYIMLYRTPCYSFCVIIVHGMCCWQMLQA